MLFIISDVAADAATAATIALMVSIFTPFGWALLLGISSALMAIQLIGGPLEK